MLGNKPISEQEALQAAEAQKNLAYVDQNWGSAGTAAIGAFSGLTLGLGPALAGVGPGHLRAAQVSPLYTAGDIAGTVAPALLSGGESAIGRGLSMTPAGLMGMAGGAAERLAGGVLGDSAGLLGRMGSTPIKMAARGAAEGGLINMGHAIGDGIINNKPLSAEAIAASGVDGALFGGLIGGTLGTVGSIGTRAVEGMADVAKGVAGRGVKGVSTMAKGFGMEAGEVGNDVKSAHAKLKSFGDILDTEGANIGDSTSTKLAATKKYIDVQTAARKDAIQSMDRDITGAIDQIDRRLESRLTNDLVEARRGTPNELRAESTVQNFLKSLKGEPSKVAPVVEEGVHIPGETTEVKLGKLPNGTQHVGTRTSPEINRPGTNLPGYSETNSLTWQKLIQARDQLAAKIESKASNMLIADQNTLNRELLNSLDSEIHAGMVSAGKTPGIEGMAEKYASSTQGLVLAHELDGYLGRKAEQALMSTSHSVTPRDLGTFAGMTAIGHPAAGMAWLASKGIGNKLQGRFEPWMAQMAYNNAFGTKAAAATQSVQSKIGSTLKSFFKSATKMPAAGAQVAKAEKNSAKRGPQWDRKNFEEAATRAEQLLSANHQDKVRRYAQSMVDAGYPELAGAMMGLNQRAVQYVAWNTPPRQATKGITSLRPVPVSKVPTLDEHKFMRMWKGVTSGPHAILDDLENGTLSRDTVQAFNYVYPELRNEFAQEAASHIQQMKASGHYLDVDKIINLGVALDSPVDRILEKDYVAAVQTSLTAPPANQPPSEQSSPPASMSVSLTQSGLLTPLQSIQNA